MSQVVESVKYICLDLDGKRIKMFQNSHKFKTICFLRDLIKVLISPPMGRRESLEDSAIIYGKNQVMNMHGDLEGSEPS